MANLRDYANSRGKTLLLKSILKEKALEYINSCFCAIKNSKSSNTTWRLATISFIFTTKQRIAVNHVYPTENPRTEDPDYRLLK